MLTLFIASAFIIGCNYALECPDGTSQVGTAGAVGTADCRSPAAPGNVNGYLNKFDLSTIEDCLDYVENIDKNYGCTSFTFDSNYQALGDVAGRSLCIPFEFAIVSYTYPAGSNGMADQILCDIIEDPTASPTQNPTTSSPTQEGDSSIPECPGNTEQIGTTGTFFRATLLTHIYGKTIEECRDDCLGYYDSSRGACTAIAFDNDYRTDDASPSLCMLYSVNGQTQTLQLRRGYRVDQILCRLLDIFPEGSSAIAGLLNFDGLDVTDNGNGEFVQFSAYVVHGIVGLVFVNIVCLLVYCWNKRKSNNGKYKVVSMRSDIDEEMEVN